MLIDILATVLICIIIGGVTAIIIVMDVRAKQMNLRGYVAILTCLAIILIYIVFEIIIKGGIHL